MLIGTANGLTAASNAVGIQVVGSSGNRISNNVISGNAGRGISIADPTNGLPSNDNQILGNDIGVDSTGYTAVSNGGKASTSTTPRAT